MGEPVDLAEPDDEPEDEVDEEVLALAAAGSLGLLDPDFSEPLFSEPDFSEPDFSAGAGRESLAAADFSDAERESVR